MLSRLCLSPSTNHTLLIEIEELTIVLIPKILSVWFHPNPIIPPSFMVRNINFSPVMCREQPLSRYHDLCFSFLLKHICSINNFRLRYPYLYGSFMVSPEGFSLLLCLLLEVTWLMFIQDSRFNTIWF